MSIITGPIDTVKRARKLRSEMSLPETLLWRELRKRPGGFKFRRQHPGGMYVLDFYCAKARLAIEVDGWAHDCEVIMRGDGAKSHFLRSQGVATTRIPAAAVLEDIEPVLLRIVEICEERVSERSRQPGVPLHHPTPFDKLRTTDGPPPRSGEDQGA